LRGGLFDPDAPPSQQLAAGSGPRAGARGQAEATGNSVECMRSNRPAERPGELGTRPRHPAPDCAFRSVGLVDYGNQLEIGLAERHDSVGRAPVWMTATLDRHE